MTNLIPVEQLSKTYKIGDLFEATFQGKPFPGPIPGYEVNKFVDIYSQDVPKTKLAKFRVTEWDNETVRGIIVNTYGHNRRRGNK